MRISISNIAWDTQFDSQVLDILLAEGVDAIDIAPGKYFPDVPNTTRAEARAVRQFWNSQGIDLVGMQSLLFGAGDIHVFGETSEKVYDRLCDVIVLAEWLGITRLTFGSPKNRRVDGMPADQATCLAIDFFRRVGRFARERGVVFCLEPNPVEYGADFMTDTPSTARIVELVDHPAVKMQLDLGAVQMNGEHGNFDELIVKYYGLVGHVHVSMPQLAPVTDGVLANLGPAVKQFLPGHIATIEMLASSAPLDQIHHAVQTSKRIFE